MGEAGQAVCVYPVERIRGPVLAGGLKKALSQQKGTAPQDNRQRAQAQGRRQTVPQGQMQLRGSPVNHPKSRCHQGFRQTGSQPQEHGQTAQNDNGRNQTERGVMLGVRRGMRLLGRMGSRGKKRAVKENERVQKGQTTGGDGQ